MAKVKKSKIKKAKQSTQLPLKDMRWRPDAEIIERLVPHIGHKTLVAHDLTEAVASKKVRCMRRNVQHEHTLKLETLTNAELDAVASGKASDEIQPAGHRELVPASFWAEHCFAFSSNGEIRVELRQPPNHHGPSEPPFTWIWAFYLWQPDCETVWPLLAPQQAWQVDESEALHRRRGPKPRWQLFIAAKLYELLEKGKPIPTASELDQLCELELGHQPGESAINKWLKKLPI
jgi:hypothetical protein